MKQSSAKVLAALATAACWLGAFPWALWVSGYVRWYGLWLAAGVVVWKVFPELAQPDPFKNKTRQVLRRLDQNPYGLLPGLLTLLTAILFFALFLGLSVATLAKATDLPGLAAMVGLGLLGAGCFFSPNTYTRNATLWLGLMLLGARAFLGGAGVRGVDLPVPLMGWCALWVALLLTLRLKVHRPLAWLFFFNTALTLMALEFYVAPLPAQRHAVTAQKGVRMLSFNPRLDYRWALEGCEKKTFWMGTRVLAGIGKTTTLLKNKKAFRLGGSTADNGAIDCPLRLLMTGDQGHRGGVYVLSENNGKVLYHTPRPKGFESGVTGMAYDPRRAWLFAAKEAETYIWWLNVQNPHHPVVKKIRQHATNLWACQHTADPCLVGASQKWLHFHHGDALEKTILTPRVGRSLAPNMALDETHGRVFVADLLRRRVMLLRLPAFQPAGFVTVGLGMRYMTYWPHAGKVVGANFMNGWLYEFSHHAPPRRLIFVGRKTRALTVSRDGKSLLWCAASACYRWKRY